MDVCPHCGEELLPDLNTDEGMEQEFERVYNQEQRDCGGACTHLGYCPVPMYDSTWCLCLQNK